MSRPLYVEIRESANSGDLKSTFIQVMGWGAPTGGTVRTQASGQFWDGQLIANLKGFNVLLVPVGELPDTSVQREVDKAFFKQFAERITIFQSPTMTSWLWPRKRASGFLAAEKYEYASGSMPDYLAQKLAAISFTVADHTRGITLGQVRDKVRGQFDTSAVTKKFYEDFKNQHEALTTQIHGLPESEAHSYSSLMLNRLMFIYFLQKKEFINGDANYLRTCLDKLQKLNSEIKFYSFYKDLLRTLFFEGLNRQPHEFTDPKIAEILGDPPYINGGIFGASEIEQAFEIEIPDKAFEDIFNLFDSYRWHLDTSPTGNSNEINPEVIGYIFEQYINYTANGRKDNGAYYTPQDVCAFMAKNTILPSVTAKLLALDNSIFSALKSNPISYINSDMLHGWDYDKNVWIGIPQPVVLLWNDDPVHWNKLDEIDIEPTVCLPGESWVESLHRRVRVSDLIRRFESDESFELNDLTSYPIDSVKIVADFIEVRASSDQLKSIWSILSQLKVIDPTCGSGAFLFGALEILEDLYSATVSGLERVNQQKFLEAKLGDPQRLNTESRRKYLIRRLISRNNLYGTDLMEDAIETAKLRLFLSLVACLDKKEDLDPLPDLDFNLKCANLVVGFYDEGDASRVSNNMWAESTLSELAPRIAEFKDLHKSFLSSVQSEDYISVSSKKQQLMELSFELRRSANLIYADSTDVDTSKIEEWVDEFKPFHWFIEFPEVISQGGFDIVIGNPPYIAMNDLTAEQKNVLKGFSTLECPDFYAVCYERSLQLLKDGGMHAMIVMLNLAFAEKFDKLRSLLDSQGCSEWWSSYGKRPDSLFAGVEVCNTILILGPGTNKFSTGHKIFTKKTRPHLFSTIDFHKEDRRDGQVPLRGGIAGVLVRAISNSTRGTSARSGQKVYSTRSARYWYSVLPLAVPILDASKAPIPQENKLLKPIELLSSETSDVALALMGGKLGYLWWSATGDDFNSGPKFGEKVLGVANGLAQDKLLNRLAKDVVAAASNQYFMSSNASKNYVNIRWSAIRQTTDLFDRHLLSLIGLEAEWANLNVWYRQTMKSSGDNFNSQTVSSGEIEILNSWYKTNFLS